MKRLLIYSLILLLALPSQAADLLVNVYNFTSGQVNRRRVTLTLVNPGPVVQGPWLIAGDSVSQLTDSSGQTTFSNLLAGTYRLDIAGSPGRSFPLGIPDTNGLINAASFVATTNNVPLFYTAEQIDQLIGAASGTNGIPRLNGTGTNTTLRGTLTIPGTGVSNYVFRATNSTGAGYWSPENASGSFDPAAVIAIGNTNWIAQSGGRGTNTSLMNGGATNFFLVDPAFSGTLSGQTVDVESIFSDDAQFVETRTGVIQRYPDGAPVISVDDQLLWTGWGATNFTAYGSTFTAHGSTVSLPNLPEDSGSPSAVITWLADNRIQKTTALGSSLIDSAITRDTELNTASNILSRVGATIFVDATHGNDSTGARGIASKPFLTLQGAVAAASDGDKIIVGPGTYVNASSIAVKAGVKIQGAGMRNTVILSSADPAVIYSNRVVLEALTIRGTNISQQYPLANSGAQATNVVFNAIEVVGVSDALVFNGNALGSIKAFGCIFDSKADTVSLVATDAGTNGVYEFFDCNITANTNNGAVWTNTVRGLHNSYGDVRVYGGSITASNGVLETDGVVVSKALGRVLLSGTRVLGHALGGSAVALRNSDALLAFNDPTGVLLVHGTHFPTNTTAGTITYTDTDSYYGVRASWTNLVNVPAGFADGTDDGGGGSGLPGTNTVIAYGDAFRTNFLAIGSTGTTNIGALFATSFSGDGSALTAVNAATATTVDGTDSTSFVGIYDSATGNQAAKTDGALTYNASSGALAATSFSGDGSSLTAVNAATVTTVDGTDSTSFVGIYDSATGNQAAKTDGALLYNASTGALVANSFTGSDAGLTNPATSGGTVSLTTQNNYLITANGATVTLPGATTNGGRFIWIHATPGVSASLATVSGQTINGRSSPVSTYIANAQDGVVATSDGANWLVFVAGPPITAGAYNSGNVLSTDGLDRFYTNRLAGITLDAVTINSGNGVGVTNWGGGNITNNLTSTGSSNWIQNLWTGDFSTSNFTAVNFSAASLSLPLTNKLLAARGDGKVHGVTIGSGISFDGTNISATAGPGGSATNAVTVISSNNVAISSAATNLHFWSGTNGSVVLNYTNSPEGDVDVTINVPVLVVDYTNGITQITDPSGTNSWLTLSNGGGWRFQGVGYFDTWNITGALNVTNMYIGSNTPTSSGTPNSALIFNSNNAAMYWVGYNNAGSPVSTNDFLTPKIRTAVTTVNVTNLTSTGAKITELDIATGTGTFAFQYNIVYSATNTGIGVKFGINHTGTASKIVANMRYASTGGTAATAAATQVAAVATGNIHESFSCRSLSTTSPNLGPTVSVDAAASDMLVIVEGVIVVTGAGNLELWHASEAASRTYVQRDSILVLTKAL